MVANKAWTAPHLQVGGISKRSRIVNTKPTHLLVLLFAAALGVGKITAWVIAQLSVAGVLDCAK